MKLRLALACVALSAAAALPAQAEVRYTFSGFNDQDVPTSEYTNPLSFTLTVPDFITADTFFGVSQLDACSNGAAACTGIKFTMDGTQYGAPGNQVIEFGTASLTSFHYFDSGPPAAFSTPGVFSTTFSFNPATLTVAVLAVPEPETYALMMAGLGVVGWVSRRRKQQLTA